ncbi:MAG: hypothetical protein HQ556_14450 [Candidatus Marinimicrobia bacterium]|nr:hypothetical protein [Candidatus Neomarinimicrobiota bacterium]
MTKSNIADNEKSSYLNIWDASAQVGFSTYGIDACKELIGFRVDVNDKGIQPMFHNEDIRLFKDSVCHQVLSKIDLFTDSDYSRGYQDWTSTDEKLAKVISRVQDEHLIRMHNENTWDQPRYISSLDSSAILTYSQAAIYLDISPDELDEIVRGGLLFSKRLTDETGSYWIFKKSWLDDYKNVKKSKLVVMRLKALVSWFKALLMS